MASRTRTSQRDFSLIVAERHGRVLTVGDHATLAVFSSEVEAESFLHLADENESWKVQKTSLAKLISLLDRAGAERVALDPSPEMFTERLVWLVSVDKYRFVAEIYEAQVDLEPARSLLDCSGGAGRSSRTPAPGEGPTPPGVTVVGTVP